METCFQVIGRCVFGEKSEGREVCLGTIAHREGPGREAGLSEGLAGHVPGEGQGLCGL